MARVFITGSADGLGHLSAKMLTEQGHRVVLHARNEQRAEEAMRRVQGVEAVLTGDLSDVQQTIALAHQVNNLGRFDAVIHNAGIYSGTGNEIFTVNTLAPYILTCLITRPERLVYLSSGLHMQGKARLDSFGEHADRISYSDTKLHVMMLCRAVDRMWPGVVANAVDPGWVPTKMGGAGAPGDLLKGYQTQVWLVASNDKEALTGGRYLHHKQVRKHNAEADDTALQDRFLEACEKYTGVTFPTSN